MNSAARYFKDINNKNIKCHIALLSSDALTEKSFMLRKIHSQHCIVRKKTQFSLIYLCMDVFSVTGHKQMVNTSNVSHLGVQVGSHLVVF